MPERKIIHIDMDAFYASVEQRDHPEYRGRPLVVGRADGRGVVAAASYEARQYGIRSAMPSVRAVRLCPDLIFVPGRMEVYRSVSAQIHRIFHEYTDLVEPLALDEAFLDVTENKPGLPLAVDVARAIRRRIRDELGLVASAGVSYNKFLAKVASDYRKPDGLCTIHPDRAAAFIARLPIEAFWGVGRVTARRMHELGIRSGADLRAQPLDFLVERFGKAGRLYHQFAQGIDLRPVCPTRVRKSVGCEPTFESDRVTLGEMSEELYAPSARVRRFPPDNPEPFARRRAVGLIRIVSAGGALAARVRRAGPSGQAAGPFGVESGAGPAARATRAVPPAATGVLSAGFRTRRILRAGFPFGIGPLAERVLLVRSLSFPVGRSVAGKVFRALSRSVAAVSRPFTAFGRSVRPEDFRLFQPSAIQSRLPCSVAVVSVHRPARM